MSLSQLISSDEIRRGERYTFTFDSGSFFHFTNEAKILEGLRKYLASYGEVISVIRPFLSSRYIVIVVPKLAGQVLVWEGIMLDAWKSIGFNDITLLQVEGGTVSTQPGGLAQIAQQAGETIGITAKGLISSIAPYLLIGVLGYIGVLFFKKKKD